MASVYFCSDLHFGHKGIAKFRNVVVSEEDNRELIKRNWKALVTKRDIVYVLGDAAFDSETVKDFGDLPGRKFLVRGNHDKLNTSVYLKYFDEVYGILKFKEFWLTHAPIHPDELRNRVNLHGHVHYSTIKDPRYFNCCPENLWETFGTALISLDQVRDYLKQP